MARVILGAAKGQIVDHRNHDTLDNRRANLRICSPGESTRNRRKTARNTSTLIGVGWNKSCNKWEARIRHEGGLIHLGFSKDKLEAARIRDEAAKFLHGEFAVLNFPEAQ